MWNRIFRTGDDWTATVLRITLGLVILPHGLQKAFGWFGGGGINGTLGFFESIGIPAALGVLVILAESVGAVGLILGVGGRLMAAGIGAVLLGAMVTVHLPNGFFMNWSGAQAGEGFEYHLIALAIVTALLIKGSGALSVDRKLAEARAGG